jgi:hypothetical protein
VRTASLAAGTTTVTTAPARNNSRTFGAATVPAPTTRQSRPARSRKAGKYHNGFPPLPDFRAWDVSAQEDY